MIKTLNFTSGVWHVWNGVSAYLLSNEATKELLSFHTTDDVINHLYMNGAKDVARELNAQVKATVVKPNRPTSITFYKHEYYATVFIR